MQGGGRRSKKCVGACAWEEGLAKGVKKAAAVPLARL